MDQTEKTGIPRQTDLPEFPEEVRATFIPDGTTRNWAKIGLLTSNVGDGVMENQTIYLGKRLVKSWGDDVTAYEVIIRPIRKR